MQILSNVELALAALLVEAAVGYPEWVYRRIGHPVTWIGALIGGLDARLNTPARSDKRRRVLGVISLAAVLAVTAGVTVALERVTMLRPAGWIVLVLASSSLLAQRSLETHVRAVAEALERNGLPGGRLAVSKIVGRDPEGLDEAGVSRAAIESLAENFADGVVAPAFWMAVAGLPGAAVYKAANTADSMIGHRTSRHAAFGWAAARFDDAINLPASRLTALFLVVGAFAVGASAKDAARAVMEDASKHRSPNAGWPEAAMAGALGLSLAGPRVYGGILVEDACMGHGRREATAADIRRALRLYRAARGVPWAVLAAIILAERLVLGN
jgi:adenosylcobinamide-phosphate synthase